jgi:parallel beta-helix repeat protein
MRRAVSWVSWAIVLFLAGQVSAALPAGWSNQDIGTTGGRAEETGGTWIVSGDGADIWGGADAFHFVYMPLSGNGEITARVVSRGTGSNNWSKGGVMIRETLTPGSKHTMMAITGGDGGGLAFQNRSITGDGHCLSAHGNPVVAPPYWVRLKRDGNTITAYSSANGIDWLPQPAGVGGDASPNPVTIAMTPSVFVGLFVCSHAAGEIRTYTFDHVTVGRPLTAAEPSPEDRAVHPDTWARLSWTPGATAASHDVYFGDNYAAVRDGTGDAFRGNQRLTQFTVGLPGTPYPEDLARGVTYYWRIDEVESDGVTTHRGAVWRFLVSTPKAHSPVPPDGAKLVATSVTLTWAAGSDALAHRVYFGTDLEAVANGTGGKYQTSAEYLCPVLQPDTTYYWRVDESIGRTTHQGGVWSFTTRPAQLASATFYYVDAGHPEAADTNPGTEALPWKTIRRATQSPQPGDIVLIKAGTYREEVILQRSGTSARPIQFWAYPGQEGEVIINAAEPVTRWHKCTGPTQCAGNPFWNHIYYADVADLVQAHPNSAFAVRQVFQHGQLLNRSRYPNAGWSYPTSVADPRTKFADQTRLKPDGYFVGSICHVKTAVWALTQIPITDYSRGTVTLAAPTPFNIATTFGYYITSIVGEINEEGEWAYDPAQQRIFLWPKGDIPQDVEFTYRNYCLYTYWHTTWNIVRGLTMRNAYQNGIWLYQATDLTIEDNTVEYTFDCGIFLQATTGECANNHIVNNKVRYSGATGISMDLTARNNTIEGNYVYATGTDHFGGDLMNGSSHGVFISGPGARVYNNRIDCTGYTGLYLYGDPLNRDVSYNYITNVALALSDAGGIYTGGYYAGSEKDHIHHNIIEDVIGCRSMERDRDRGLPVTPEKYAGDSPGIYVDEQGNHRVIERNTVLNSHMAGIFFHWAPDNVVQQNTLYGNRVAQVYFSGKNEARTRLVDDVVLDNILFATEAPQKTLCITMNYDDVRFGRSDNNYFYHPRADQHVYLSRYVAGPGGTIRVVQEDLTLDGWRAMSGYDRNSKDFAYLSQFPDMSIDQAKQSQIVYNPSLETVSVDLGDGRYCDVQGNKIYGTLRLQPFESKVLISASYETSELLRASGLHVR